MERHYLNYGKDPFLAQSPSDLLIVIDIENENVKRVEEIVMNVSQIFNQIDVIKNNNLNIWFK